MLTKKVTELTEITTTSGSDVLYIIDNSSGSPTSKKITISNLFNYLYPLDAPPTSPHSKDDEFGGSLLDAKWTNPATSTRTINLSFSVGKLILEPSEAGTGSTSSRGGFGIRQDAPTGSFSISSRIAHKRGDASSDDGRIGIFVANTSGSKGHIVGIQDSSSRIVNADGFTYSETADWGTFDGYDQYATTYPSPFVGYWYKIYWDSSGSSLSFYFSLDGTIWNLLATRTGQSQPNRIGLAIWGNTANIRADHCLYSYWFRVTEP